MPLLKCSPGIIFSIAKMLSQRDLNSFSQTNHYIHAICMGLLPQVSAQVKNELLLQEAKNGCEPFVEFLVAIGADIATRDTALNYRRTALQWAAFYGHQSVASFLLSKGAGTEITPPSEIDGTCERAALQWAVIGGHKSMINLLLRNGANIEATSIGEDLDGGGGNGGCRRALHWAAVNRDESITRLLLESGADINATDSQDSTALIISARNRNDNVSQVLLSHRANINYHDRWGQTALSFEIENKNFERVNLLLELGFNTHAADMSGFPVLLHAISEDADPRIVELLLEYGCDVNAYDDFEGKTALHRAVEVRNDMIAWLLLNNGADIEAQFAYGTPLQYAATQGQYDMVELLLRKGALVNGGIGPSPLHSAVEIGDVAIARLLLDNGANIEARYSANTKNDGTPLYYASMKNHSHMVELLVEEGAHIDASTCNRRTALHAAAENGNLYIAQLLLDKRADIEAKYSGGTPLCCASRNNHDGMVEFLADKGANINAKAVDGKTALHMAAGNGNVAIAQFLLERGADTEIKFKYEREGQWKSSANNRKDMARFLLSKYDSETAEDKYLETIRFLLEGGAKTKCSFVHGTALHYAAMEGQTDIVRLLLDFDVSLYDGEYQQTPTGTPAAYDT